MRIISKNGEKDYYDYLQGHYGIDNTIVYDRRESENIATSYAELFSTSKGLSDRRRVLKSKWNALSYNLRNFFRGEASQEELCDGVEIVGKNVLEGDIRKFVLEVGYKCYLFETHRYLDDNGDVKLSYILLESWVTESKTKDAPIVFIPIGRSYYHGESLQNYKNFAVENPILRDTWIPKVIPADDVWRELYDYISSRKDKPFTDSRTDKEHIESHGFDAKISFRHRRH